MRVRLHEISCALFFKVIIIMDETALKSTETVRHEVDLIGGMDIPSKYYYGIQTFRARDNFQISRSKLSYYPESISALAIVKQAAASANSALGLLEHNITDAIVKACEDRRAGKLHAHFVVDMLQGGAGTSTNTTANDGIANLALECLGKE